MTQLSRTEKVEKLKQLSESNFTNRTMFMLAGAEDFLTQERYKNDRYYIDMIYDLAAPELMANPEKPSKALTALAFNGAFRPEDYQNLIDAGKQASASELKEFLTQKVDHAPKEKVVNYLSFPMLAMMTKHLAPQEAVDILLIEPDMIKKSLPNIRLRTLLCLVPNDTYSLLKSKAPAEIQADLRTDDKVPAIGKIHGIIMTKLDARIIEAAAHWVDVRYARKIAHQTGMGLKIQNWLQDKGYVRG